MGDSFTCTGMLLFFGICSYQKILKNVIEEQQIEVPTISEMEIQL